MSLGVPSRNISENDEKKNRISIKDFLLRKWKYIVFVGILVIAILIVLHFVNKNGIDKLREKYEANVLIYNQEINEYNMEVDRFVSLCSFLKRTDGNSFTHKKMMISDFDSYYQNGANEQVISDGIEQCRQEKSTLSSAYDSICLAEYNALVLEYNDNVRNYNSLIEIVGKYEIGGSLASEKEFAAIGEENKAQFDEWKNVESYKNSLNDIKSKIDALIQKYYDVCLFSYDSVISDYNVLAAEYNKLVKSTSIDFVKDMHYYWLTKSEADIEAMNDLDAEKLCQKIEKVLSDTESLAAEYLIISQITNPNEAWVMKRLKNISEITKAEAVTKQNDPNGLLGKEGGYTACIYFTVKSIDSNSVAGNTVVDKGTDAGGAIEIYETKEYALNRCDYLSQFDGTLLYSGSYAVVGTMVIRTSYKLNNEQQVDLTNKITEEFTIIR